MFGSYATIVVSLFYQSNNKAKDMNTSNRIAVKTIVSGDKSITIMRMVKPGTERVFFYPQTSDGKRLNSTLYARMYEAVALGKVYLRN
jgi:hypothetical protein